MKILDARQEAKLNSYEVVEAHCNENPDIVTTNTAFAAAFNELKPLIAGIKAAAQQSGAVITGIAAAKKISKRDLSQSTSKIAGLIYAYAAKTGNTELKNAVDFSATDIKRLKDGEMALRCREIYDLGVANQTDLKNYGVTPAKLEALQTAIDNYTQSAPKPRAAIADRSVGKANLKAMFAQADRIFTEQLDLLIKDIAETHTDFAAAYKAKRKIVDPKSKKKTNGTGTDNGNITPT